MGRVAWSLCLQLKHPHSELTAQSTAQRCVFAGLEIPAALEIGSGGRDAPSSLML